MYKIIATYPIDAQQIDTSMRAQVLRPPQPPSLAEAELHTLIQDIQESATFNRIKVYTLLTQLKSPEIYKIQSGLAPILMGTLKAGVGCIKPIEESGSSGTATQLELVSELLEETMRLMSQGDVETIHREHRTGLLRQIARLEGTNKGQGDNSAQTAFRMALSSEWLKTLGSSESNLAMVARRSQALLEGIEELYDHKILSAIEKFSAAIEWEAGSSEWVEGYTQLSQMLRVYATESGHMGETQRQGIETYMETQIGIQGYEETSSKWMQSITKSLRQDRWDEDKKWGMVSQINLAGELAKHSGNTALQLKLVTAISSYTKSSSTYVRRAVYRVLMDLVQQGSDAGTVSQSILKVSAQRSSKESDRIDRVKKMRNGYARYCEEIQRSLSVVGLSPSERREYETQIAGLKAVQLELESEQTRLLTQIKANQRSAANDATLDAKNQEIEQLKQQIEDAQFAWLKDEVDSRVATELDRRDIEANRVAVEKRHQNPLESVVAIVTQLKAKLTGYDEDIETEINYLQTELSTNGINYRFGLKVAERLYDCVQMIGLDSSYGVKTKDQIRKIYRQYLNQSLLRITTDTGIESGQRQSWQSRYSELSPPDGNTTDTKLSMQPQRLESSSSYVATGWISASQDESSAQRIELLETIYQLKTSSELDVILIQDLRKLASQLGSKAEQDYVTQWLYELLHESFPKWQRCNEGLMTKLLREEMQLQNGASRNNGRDTYDVMIELVSDPELLWEISSEIAELGELRHIFMTMIEEAIRHQNGGLAQVMLQQLAQLEGNDLQNEIARDGLSHLEDELKGSYEGPFLATIASSIATKAKSTDPNKALKAYKYAIEIQKRARVDIAGADWVMYSEYASEGTSQREKGRVYRESMHELELIKRAHDRAVHSSSTSDAEIVEQLGQIYLYQGDYEQSEGNPIKASQSYTQLLDLNPSDELAGQGYAGLHESAFQGFYGPYHHALESVSEEFEGDDETIKKILTNGGVVMRGVYSGTRVLNESEVPRLFDKNDAIRRDNEEGSRNVARIGTGPNQIHMKGDPGCPGIEYAVGTLFHLMVGGGITPTELMVVRKGTQAYVIQGSKSVSGASSEGGKSLRTLMLTQTKIGKEIPKTKAEQEALFESLNPTHYSAMVVMSLLIDPEDWSPGNMILSPNAETGEMEIIGIDNDHMFLKEELIGQQSEVKNIICCLDQMKRPVDATMREILLSDEYNPIEKLKLWLHDLEGYNRLTIGRANIGLKGLFGEESREALYDKRAEANRVAVHSFLAPGLLSRIYGRYLKIRRELNNSEGLTHIELMKRVNLRVGLRYERVLTNPKLSIKDRFDTIGKGAYKGGQTKTTSTMMVQKMLSERDKRKTARIATLESDAYRPITKMCELELYSSGSREYQEIESEFRQGRYQGFGDAPYDIQERILEKVDFGDETLVYGATEHESLMGVMKRESYRSLTLRGNSRLENHELGSLLENSRETLEWLNIAGCEKISNEGYGGILFGNRVGDKLKSCEKLSVENVKCRPLRGQLYGTYLSISGTNELINEEDIRDKIGENYFGLKEWRTVFPGCDIGEVPDIPAKYLEVLDNANELKEKGEPLYGSTVGASHLLVLQPKTLNGEELTLNKWWEIMNKGHHKSSHTAGKFYSDEDRWWKGEAFAKKAVESHWVLMPKGCMPESKDKTYSEQESHISSKYPEYEITTGVELGMGIMQYYLNTGKYLYSNEYSRTKDKTAAGFPVHIGHFEASGLNVFYHDYRYGNIGVGVVLRN